MAKTRRMIGESLKQVDAVAELIDARIPASSRNPELLKWIGGKPEILILNKCDMADGDITKEWLRFYREQGIPAIPCDSRSGAGVEKFVPLLRQTLSPLIARREAKGMGGQPLRVMLAGVPNVGKSSFINRAAGGRRAKAEDRPGVTRGRQWVSLAKQVELLDMPGVLWPKFEDPAVGERLAFTGAVKDEVVDKTELAALLMGCLADCYPDRLAERYRLRDLEDLDGWALLEAAGRNRGMLVSGGEVDMERAASVVLDEFRGGKLGRITLERPALSKEPV